MGQLFGACGHQPSSGWALSWAPWGTPGTWELGEGFHRQAAPTRVQRPLAISGNRRGVGLAVKCESAGSGDCGQRRAQPRLKGTPFLSSGQWTTVDGQVGQALSLGKMGDGVR